MNETIRELLLQAREETREGNWKPPTAVWTERFAELIVRECLDITSKVRKNPYIPDGDQAGKINREIKQHFGVE